VLLSVLFFQSYSCLFLLVIVANSKIDVVCRKCYMNRGLVSWTLSWWKESLQCVKETHLEGKIVRNSNAESYIRRWVKWAIYLKRFTQCLKIELKVMLRSLIYELNHDYDKHWMLHKILVRTFTCLKTSYKTYIIPRVLHYHQKFRTNVLISFNYAKGCRSSIRN